MRPVKLLKIARRLLCPLALLCAQSGCTADGQGGWWRNNGQGQGFGQNLFRGGGERFSQLEAENQQLRRKVERLTAEANDSEERLIQRASEREEIEAELQAAQRLLARYRKERSGGSGMSSSVSDPPANGPWSSGDDGAQGSAATPRTSRKPPTARISPGSLKSAPPIQRSSESDPLPLRQGETPINLPRSPIQNPRLESGSAFDDDAEFSDFDAEARSAPNSPWLPVQKGLSRETEKFDFDKQR